VETDQTVRAFVPPGAATGPVAITTPWGTDTGPESFTVIVPPVITSYAPAHGPVGSQVTIEGSGFSGMSEVAFGGVIATSFTVDSDVRIRVTVPSGAGLGPIRLTNPAGSDETGLFLVTLPRQLTLVATDDAQVRDDQRDKNYGTEKTLRLRRRDPKYYSFLKFNASGVGGFVTSAKLRLFVTDGSSDGGSFYQVSNDYDGTSTPWAEDEITWRNAPTIDGDVLASAGAVSADEWIELDVTTAITGPGEYSFGIKSGTTNSTYFSSEEGANPPELEVEIDPPPAIASFAPTITPRGATVTIVGADFANATSVAFNGTEAEVYTIDSDTQITAVRTSR
jgi:hypothetical protein